MRKTPWLVISILFCGLISLPILTILYHLFQPRIEIWSFLWETGLLELIWNTLRLSIGVGGTTFLLGTSLAWLVVMYDFPGRRIFEGALLLPLAIPGYVFGVVFLSHWDYTGLIPTLLRQWFGYGIWIPELRSYVGVVFVLTLVLYPYVYLLSRGAFRNLSLSYLEVANSLGKSRHQLFWKVALPMARPSIAVGVMLVVMETIADFGTVEVFSYETFTTSIYQLWFGMFNRDAAIQLAGLLMVFNTILFYYEGKSRGKSKFFQINGKPLQRPPFELKGRKAFIAAAIPTVVLTISFVIPVAILLQWVFSGISEQFDATYLNLLKNSILVGVVASLVTLVFAIFFSYSKRLFPKKWMYWVTRVATTGYSMPGSVIAVGVLIPLAFADRWLNVFSSNVFDQKWGLIFTGSIIGLVFAYSVRFLTVSFNAIDSNLSTITPSMDKVSYSLGKSYRHTLWKVHVPLLRSGMLTGCIIVFVDVVKEMPATLLLRPFGFNTLSTRIWELTAEAYWEDAALPSLTIVIAALIPVIMLIRMGRMGSASS